MKQKLSEGLLDRKKNSNNPKHDKTNEIIGRIIDYAGNQDNQDEEEEDDVDSKKTGDKESEQMT